MAKGLHCSFVVFSSYAYIFIDKTFVYKMNCKKTSGLQLFCQPVFHCMNGISGLQWIWIHLQHYWRPPCTNILVLGTYAGFNHLISILPFHISRILENQIGITCANGSSNICWICRCVTWSSRGVIKNGLFTVRLTIRGGGPFGYDRKQMWKFWPIYSIKIWFLYTQGTFALIVRGLKNATFTVSLSVKYPFFGRLPLGSCV